MTKSTRKKIIFIAIVVLVLLGIFFIIWRLTNFGIPKNPTNTNQPPKFVPASSNLQYKEGLTAPMSNTEFTIINLARNYAERLGSWSTDQPGHNLEELYPLSTDKMIKYLKNLATNSPTSQFSGISTKSLTTEIKSSTDDKAEVLVKTQRIETSSNGPVMVKNTIYQDIKITLLKSDEDWLVDGAYWQEVNP